MPAWNSWESPPKPMRVAGCNVFSLLSLMAQVKLGQQHVGRSRDFEVAWRSHDHGDFFPRPLDQRSLIGADEAVGGSLVETTLYNVIAEPLRSLRHYHAFARHGGGDQGAVRSALDLFDGIDGR